MIKEYLERQFQNYHAITSGYVTPEMFGAKGDGVTDDSSAFILACNYADTNRLIMKLSKTYLLNSAISFNEGGTGKYFHLTFEGTAVSGTNTSVDKYLKKPINIIAPNGFNVPQYTKFRNVGFGSGITIVGQRVRLEGCIFQDCETAITLQNSYVVNGQAQWKGEIFIDNCDFSHCTVSIDSQVSDTTPVNYVKDSRITGCTIINGDVFMQGRFSAWIVNNNHIYSTYSIKNAKLSSCLIENNYFDTNNLSIDAEIGTDSTDGAMVQICNNQFFKYESRTVDGTHVPVCRFTSTGAKDKLLFNSNHCTKNYGHADEYFVEVNGGLNISYDDNVYNINFLNMKNGKELFSADSNTIIMPKHTDRTDLIRSGVLDKPIICLTFDGWDINTINTIAPYLQDKGLPFTVFYGESDNTPNTPKTQADIEAIHTIPSYGGEIQFYTSQDKRTFEGTTNYREQWAQVKSAYDRYLSWGLPKPKVCSLAGGVWGDILVGYLHELGIKGARATKEDPNPNLNEESLIYGSYQLQGNNYSNRNWDILNTPNWYNSNNFKIFTCHKIMSGDDSADDANLTEEHMKAFIDDIADSVSNPEHRYTVMTFSELWDYIHFPRSAEVGQKVLIWESDGQHEYIKTESSWRELTI